MFCNKCGAEITPGSTVCQNCGSPVTTSANQNPTGWGQSPADAYAAVNAAWGQQPGADPYAAAGNNNGWGPASDDAYAAVNAAWGQSSGGDPYTAAGNNNGWGSTPADPYADTNAAWGQQSGADPYTPAGDNAGAKQNDTPANTPVNPPETYYPAAAPQPKKKSGAKALIIAIACVLVIGSLAVGAFFLFGGDSKSSDKKEKEDTQSVESVAKEYLIAYYGGDTDTVSKYLLVDADMPNRDEIEDYYGEYSVSVEILSSEKADEDELYDVKDGFEEEYGDKVDVSKIQEAYLVEYSVTIEGKKDDYEEDTEIIFVKYNGKWKVF